LPRASYDASDDARHRRKSPGSGQYGFISATTRRNESTSRNIRLILLIYK